MALSALSLIAGAALGQTKVGPLPGPSPEPPAELAALQRKAASGDLKAQFELGQALDQTGQPADQTEAIKWFDLAAQGGHPQAQLALARAYELGRGVPLDLALARQWYRQACQPQASSQAASARPGQARPGPTKKPSAQEAAQDFKRFLKAAERGDPLAQMTVGVMLNRGQGAPKDPAAAVKWWRRAAESGLGVARMALGEAYERGEGVPPDQAQALSWYRLAAEKDNVQAALALARAYESGQGVAVDEAEALKWYHLAADLLYAERPEN
ncbi:MAG: SEL1-like repeat protein [Deltaproteobacteria bacterium]|nr:SEL1-like repeat protein [Deltaproteobacteria bacterium]